MDNRITTLNDYFATLRNEPAISSEELASLVDDVVLEEARKENHPTKKRGGRMAITAVIVGSLLLGGTALWFATSPEETARHPGADAGTRTSGPPAAGSRHEENGTRYGEKRVEEPGGPRQEPLRSRASEAKGARASVASAKGEVVQRGSAPPPVPVKIDGIRLVDLEERELAALGIVLDPNGTVTCYSRSVGYVRSNREGTTVREALTRYSIGAGRIVTTEVTRADLPDGIIPGVTPRLITDGSGLRRYFNRHVPAFPIPDSVRQFIDSIQALRFTRPEPVGNLIPVRIRLRSSGSGGVAEKESSELILWYRPQPEFMQRLPACLRERLEEEFGAEAEALAAQQVEGTRRTRSKLPPELAGRFDSLVAAGDLPLLPCSDHRRAAIAGEPFLDLWRSAAGAVTSTQLRPNPASGTFQLGYALAQPRTVTITLHDLQGRRVKVLSPSSGITAGEQHTGLSLEGVEPGIYLVLVSTDSGERAVQRLVVE